MRLLQTTDAYQHLLLGLTSGRRRQLWGMLIRITFDIFSRMVTTLNLVVFTNLKTKEIVVIVDKNYIRVHSSTHEIQTQVGI